MAHADLTMIVSSTDSFEDCWNPYFRLMQKFWPDCPYPVVLNTEEKTYSHPTIRVRAARVGLSSDGRRLAFSDATLRCLQQIDTKYILWTLEDLFLTGPCDTRRIEALVKAMEQNGYSCVQLLPDISTPNRYLESSDPAVVAVRQKDRYRLSLLSALWDRQHFMSYLEVGENPWQVEILGSRRAWSRQDKFMVVRPVPGSAVYMSCPTPYLMTGVTKGRWNAKVVPLFAANDIKIEYSRRGMHVEPPAILRKIDVAWRVLGSVCGMMRRARKTEPGGIGLPADEKHS